MGGRPKSENQPTHEPDGSGDPDFPQVEAFLTKEDVKECIGVRIHGQNHYLHATTARVLVFRLQGALDVWNEKLRKEKLAHPEDQELQAMPEA